MVYLIVIIALFFLTIKGYCGKKTSTAVRDTGDSVLFNFVRMVFCVIIGAALVFAEGSGGSLRVDGGMLAICAFSGIANAAFLVGWLMAVRKNSMVAMDVGMTLGSLLPALLCLVLFGQPISVPKMIGFAFILGATVILAGHSKKTAGGGFSGILLLIIATLGDGLSSFSQQLYKEYYTEAGAHAAEKIYPKSVFHFYTYVFAAAVLLLVFAAFWIWDANKKKNKRPETEKVSELTESKKRLYIPIRVLAHIGVMAVCLFAANYLQTVATNDYGMSSQVLYPIIKGGCLITVNFVAMIFFNEKMTWRSIVGSLVALVGIIVMNVL
ncbi:MAG: hypothetical protein IJ011_05715 [Clostridia bacterium]|nr:hypothetical protein [Clostridia bacterium]